MLDVRFLMLDCDTGLDTGTKKTILCPPSHVFALPNKRCSHSAINIQNIAC